MSNASGILFKTSKSSFAVVLRPLFSKFLHVGEFCFFQCGLCEDLPEDMLKGVAQSCQPLAEVFPQAGRPMTANWGETVNYHRNSS